ncbi:MAG: ABC transporter substrate-binding protein [Flavobacteriales bacterium]|nr:ABC transporter substrate-binding protein [Flavobacteriales bacterium]
MAGWKPPFHATHPGYLWPEPVHIPLIIRRSPLLAALLLLWSCTGEQGGPVRADALGGRHYGGIFNTNETEKIRSIFPLNLSQASAHRIASQIYQGLVRFDQQDLTIEPCLAERWEVDASATTYTFHLRKDVFFHADPVFANEKERRFDANAVLYCFQRICTASPENQMFWLFQDKVVGANVFYAATAEGNAPAKGVEGFEVVDEHTFRIRLTHPFPSFLHLLAHQGSWIWPARLWDVYGRDLMAHAIGTGPFRLKTSSPDEVFVLERDPDHWDRDENGNQLPFLDAVRCTLEPDKNKELDSFLAGKLSCMFEVPVDRITVLNDSLDETGAIRFLVQTVPGLAVQFYGFNGTRPPFQDVRVRRAVALAIDRRFLVDSVLKGMAVAALHGIVAPGLAGYPYELVPGHPFAPDSARGLLADAGFPNGEGFPPLILQVSAGFGYVEVAEAVQNMLEQELGVATILSMLPADQHFERIEMGRAQVWREGWLADFPDPENFLALLYGKNAVADTALPTFLNTTRYRDPRYDSLFTLAQRTVDLVERARYLALAEQVAMIDVAITPLYHERSVRLLQPWVRDLPQNPMEYRDLSTVWFDPAVKR